MPYIPSTQIQALCFSCGIWYHCNCLEKEADKEQCLKSQFKRWKIPKKGNTDKRLQELAMGFIRRGDSYPIAGSYGKIYMAKSIVSALKEGENDLYIRWTNAHQNSHISKPKRPSDYYYCPSCKDII